MNYEASLKYLDQFLNFERISCQRGHAVWNLDRMRLLLEWSGRPDRSFLPVLIAGTKGKGSTGFFLEQILCASRVPVGFYSSPHLIEPLERIRIQGRMISRKDWTSQVNWLSRFLKQQGSVSKWGAFTYFEVLTLLAVKAMKEARVRVGIFEVGLGGRLDATNALEAPLALITPISFDHEAILGDTLSKIAAEKAGILHPGAHTILAPQKPAAKKSILQKARKVRASVCEAFPLSSDRKVGLEGAHQRVNAAVAGAAAEWLRRHYGLPITAKSTNQGLLARYWDGRWERLPGHPGFFIDAAHNPASVRELVQLIQSRYRKSRSRLLIFGTSRDKPYQEMLEQLSRCFTDVILAASRHPRSREVSDLVLKARTCFRKVILAENVKAACEQVHGMSSLYDLVVGAGSFYVIGEIKKNWQNG